MKNTVVGMKQVAVALYELRLSLNWISGHDASLDHHGTARTAQVIEEAGGGLISSLGTLALKTQP